MVRGSSAEQGQNVTVRIFEMRERTTPGLAFWRCAELYSFRQEILVGSLQIFDPQGHADKPADERIAFRVVRFDLFEPHARPV